MVSEIGPANSAPTPKPIRKIPVARDSVTSLTPKSAAACGRAAESTLDANPTIQPAHSEVSFASLRRSTRLVNQIVGNLMDALLPIHVSRLCYRGGNLLRGMHSPMKAMLILENVSFNCGHKRLDLLTSQRIWHRSSNYADSSCHYRPHTQQQTPCRLPPLLCSDPAPRSQ